MKLRSWTINGEIVNIPRLYNIDNNNNLQRLLSIFTHRTNIDNFFPDRPICCFPVRTTRADLRNHLPAQCSLGVRTETACEGEKKIIGFRLNMTVKYRNIQDRHNAIRVELRLIKQDASFLALFPVSACQTVSCSSLRVLPAMPWSALLVHRVFYCVRPEQSLYAGPLVVQRSAHQ